MNVKPTWRAAWLSLTLIMSFAPLLPCEAAKNTKKENVLSIVNDDDRFMALRDAALNNDEKKAELYASQLRDFDIPSYIDYYRIRARLVKTSNREFAEFINRYEGTAIADRLRNDWLLLLGRRGEWELFEKQYPQFVVADDNQVRCYSVLHKAVMGQQVAAEALNLMRSPKDFGEACYTLLENLKQQQQITREDLQFLIRMANEQSAEGLYKRIAGMLNLNEKASSAAYNKPEQYLKTNAPIGNEKSLLWTLAIGRLAKSDLSAARAYVHRYSEQVSAETLAQAWSQVAYQASFKLDSDADDDWKKGENATLSMEAQAWRVRMALREKNWKRVKQYISQMSEPQRSDPTWIYWHGRALKAEGRQEEARANFKQIAEQMHFYGQLALEELGQKITLANTTRPISHDELAPLEKNPGLQRALRFYAMNLRFEGTREWNWELRKFNDRQHLVAAEFARRHELLDRMVNTSDRTRNELDYNQRFPTPYNENMYKSTQSLGLDMAFVYGLIRQESRFATAAKSHVGASGLMQLMPNTARYVAKKVGLGNFVPQQINDVETNITLGTNYLNMVLTDLGGSQALAAAAYNAGPGRPRSWRSKLTQSVEGAIFAETIPFTETRGYVKNVLSNATYYAALLEKKPQSLKARLGTVSPSALGASHVTDLPEN